MYSKKYYNSGEDATRLRLMDSVAGYVALEAALTS